MHLRVAVAIAIAIVAFALPSGLRTEEAPAEPRPAPRAEEAKAVGPRAPPPVELKLLDAGVEPRKTLRLAPAKGHKSSAAMVVVMETTTEIGGFPIPPQKLPTQRLTFDYEVKDVAPSGDVTYTFKIRKATMEDVDDVMPMIAESLRSTLESLEGLEGTSVVTNRGLPRSTELKLPEKASPQARQTFANMRQSFQNFAAPLPEEPVGVGARWTAATEVDVAGAMKVGQKMEYALAAFEKEAVRLKVTAEQTAGEQELGGAQGAAAMKAKLLSLRSAGQGETLADLRDVAPGTSEMEMLSETKMSMTLQGQQQTVLTKGRIQVKVEPLPQE